MKAHVLRGSKQEIAESIARIDGEVLEAVVFVAEPSAASDEVSADDIFAEMAPFMVQVGDVDYSRNTIYARMAGE